MRTLLLGALALLLTLPLTASPLVAGPNEGFVLLNGTSLFKEKSMGVLEWVEALTLGDKVTLLGGITKAKYNGNEREYYKVKLASGKEGFVRSNLLGVEGTLGVVKADSSFLYSEPRDVKITEKSLVRAQVVVVLKSGATDQFIPVVGYDEAKDVPFSSVFVTKEDVSINDVDLNTVILLTVAKAQKNPTLKKNLLTVASTKYSTSIFQDLVAVALNGGVPVPRAVKPFEGTFVVSDSNVNVRDLPNEKGSKVVAGLTKGQTLEVYEVTTDSYTVDGITAPWYHIKDGGWVFGTYLTAP